MAPCRGGSLTPSPQQKGEAGTAPNPGSKAPDPGSRAPSCHHPPLPRCLRHPPLPHCLHPGTPPATGCGVSSSVLLPPSPGTPRPAPRGHGWGWTCPAGPAVCTPLSAPQSSSPVCLLFACISVANVTRGNKRRGRNCLGLLGRAQITREAAHGSHPFQTSAPGFPPPAAAAVPAVPRQRPPRPGTGKTRPGSQRIGATANLRG